MSANPIITTPKDNSTNQVAGANFFEVADWVMALTTAIVGNSRIDGGAVTPDAKL